MEKIRKRYATICAREIYAGDPHGSHTLPLYQSTSFESPTMEEAIEIFKEEKSGYIYSRYSNPTIAAVENKLAQLEGLDSDTDCYGLLTSSGMSAISTVVSALLEKGKAAMVHPSLYGGTLEYLYAELPKAGHDIIKANFKKPEELESLLKRRHREIGMLFFETPTNPVLEILDIQAICTLAKKFHVPVVVDNTFSTSFIQRPLDLGADLVLYSTTKFINGHGNSMGGFIAGRDEELVRKKIWKTMKLMGTNISPFEAWLINQGLKTLPLRMEKQSANAADLANFLLDQKDWVKRVNYPGISTHPQHQLAKSQMSLYGSMLSFELEAGLAQTIQFANALQYSKAPTLGDVDTLLLHPASSSHINVDKRLREETGITDSQIRLSVGIEDLNDLKEELLAALAQL